MGVRFLSLPWPVAAIPCFAACELFFPDDSGSTASAQGDAGSPVPCANAQAILCDDFEEGTIDANRWTSISHEGGSSVVDATKPHRGRYSLHSRSDPVDGGMPTIATTLKHYASFPTDFYARVFVYIPSSPEPSSRELLFSLQSNSPPYPGMSLVLQSNLMTMVDWAPSPALTDNAPSFPMDAWVCVEWGVHSSTGSTQVWIDDQPAILANSTVVPSVGILLLGTGFFPAATPQPSFECWTDDLYVDSQRVGCQK